MRQGLLASLFAAALAFGFGMTQAPTGALAAPATTTDAPEALELQRENCGDHRCQPPEDCRSCPEDCGSCCGNGRCEPPEDCRSCPQDCRC